MDKQRLNDKGSIFFAKFKECGNLEDCKEAISNFQAAVELTPDNDPDKPIILNNLGSAISARFERLYNLADCEKAISCYQDAVKLTPDNDPDKPTILNNLGSAFSKRFERLCNLADCEKAISCYQDAVKLTPDGSPYKPTLLNNLGGSFTARFEREGNPSDFEKAIYYIQAAVKLTPDKHPDMPVWRNNLGDTFIERFERLGDFADCEKAISNFQAAVKLTLDDDPDKPAWLNDFGHSLYLRFEYKGDLVDCEKSISTLMAAIQRTSDSKCIKALMLNNLGSSFLARFKRLGNLDDCENAIRHFQNAIRVAPDNHSYKLFGLNNLGNSLFERFQRLGNLTDCDKAISNLLAAIHSTPDGHSKKHLWLNNLGNSFFVRFLRLSNLDDYKNAISNYQAAVKLIPDGYRNKALILNNIGNSHLVLFGLLGNLDDCENGISNYQAAVNLTPDSHPRKASRLINLGSSFLARYRRLGNLADCDNANSNFKAAIELAPIGHSVWPYLLKNFGSLYSERFSKMEDLADCKMAISYYQDAIKLTPDDDPNKPKIRNSLGTILMNRFNRHGNDVVDLNGAISEFSNAARSSIGPPADRFYAAVQWAQCAFQSDIQSSLEAYECALNLLPRVAWLGLPIINRHEELVRIGSIVREAAAAAISSNEIEKALEWLEQGRSIVWNQILQLRTPVDKLRMVNLELADRLVQISQSLERGSNLENFIDESYTPSLEEIGQKYRELTMEWERLVEDVRAISGFEDFLQPKKLLQLSDAARDGPVVIFNVHSSRCDALVLIKGSIQDPYNVLHIPLNTFNLQQATKLQEDLNGLLTSAGVRDRTGSNRVTVISKQANNIDNESRFKCILSELWNHVTKPVLEALAFSVKPKMLPRIWWCATGPLAFLPIHAAGIYDTNSVGSKNSDYVISSYTPTLSALLEPSRTVRDQPFNLLAIIQPSTPGASPLPCTDEEWKRIQKHLSNIPNMSLHGAEATVARVVQEMRKFTWLHFACHGRQNLAEPNKSAFMLQDGPLELSEIIKEYLQHADFAFLSACQTSAGDINLSEEAVHLAAGMILAGYRGVVATMWSIRDDDAPFVADEVYAHLLRNGQPDRTQAAGALQEAVQKLRMQPRKSFLSWVPFIHVGH